MKSEIEKSGAFIGEDAALVRNFQSGDKTAFDQLVLRHKNKVFNLCYRFLGDYEEADDSTQETFIKVYRSIKKFRFESAFATWLYRIAVNTCKNKLNSLQYRLENKTMPIDTCGNPEGCNRCAEIVDESLSPLLKLEKKERSSLIQQAINTLPIEKKTVLVLRDIEGMSYEEIANITGFNPGTIKSRLARARLELKNKLRNMI
ncbi:MAG: sigma-70 family RNA polymerase sigma factor [Desulfobacterales bacterium]|nr:sigma-70 family RNA polymerase sigma factor [Desulfobacterales bacterium]